MGLVGLLNANRDFWASTDAVVLSMSGDRQSRLQGAQYRQLAETARATWLQTEIQHASFKLLEIQCQQLSSINGTLSATFTLLEDTNTQLAGISGQLAETNEHLKGLRATQDENLLLIKRERTLKEVIFQLGMLIDSAVDKEDAVSAYAYHRYSLATLDRYQLGTADLSALEDKKEFDRFIKASRAVARNAPVETIATLEAFETTYLLYRKRLEVGVVHDIPRKQQLPEFKRIAPPVFVPRDAPEWKPGTPERSPVLEHRDPPPMRTMLKERAALDSRKPKPKLPPCTVPPPPRPEVMFAEITDTAWFPDEYTPPSWQNIPTQAETAAREPRPKGFLGRIDRSISMMLACGPYTRVRTYEDALRAWQPNQAGYERWTQLCEQTRLEHETSSAMLEWKQELARLEDEERFIKDVEYPNVLKDFAASEEKRLLEHETQVSEWAKRLKVFEAEEDERRVHHAAATERFKEQERLREQEMRRVYEAEDRQRFDAFVSEWRAVQAANKSLDARLGEAVKRYEDAAHGYAILMNEFLDEHSDLQAFYPKVNVVADLRQYRRDWTNEAFGNDHFGGEDSEPVYQPVDWNKEKEREKESSGRRQNKATVRLYIKELRRGMADSTTIICPICKTHVSSKRILPHIDQQHPDEANAPAERFGCST